MPYAKGSFEEKAVASKANVLILCHEPQIHQIELAQQNQEQSRANTAVDSARNERSRIYRALSHDLAQPLMAQRLFLEVLRDSSLNADQHQLLARLISCAKAMDEICSALTALGTQDGAEPAVRLIALWPLLERAINAHLPAASLKGLRIRLVPTHAMAMTDPVHLGWIVENLIANAVRFTDTGSLLVGVRRAGVAAWRIEVRDSGIGIDAEYLPKIFDEFYQAGNPERNPEKGFGIGLAVTKRLAEGLGLTLGVRTAPRRGSVFWVTLPRPSHAFVVKEQARAAQMA